MKLRLNTRKRLREKRTGERKHVKEVRRAFIASLHRGLPDSLFRGVKSWR